MPDGLCSEHSGVCIRMENLERQMKDQGDALKNNQKTLSGIKNWLMLLMGGVIVQLVLTIIAMASKG